MNKYDFLDEAFFEVRYARLALLADTYLVGDNHTEWFFDKMAMEECYVEETEVYSRLRTLYLEYLADQERAVYE